MLLPKLGGLWLFPPWDFPHQMRVTLWTTTAFHLDTPILRPDPELDDPELDRTDLEQTTSKVVSILIGLGQTDRQVTLLPWLL